MPKEIKFAPHDVFEQILEYMVIPTFDLVIEYGNKGVIVVHRIIDPYKDVWALPGLRMYKGESIDNALNRIAQKEVGLRIDPRNKIFLGQFVGKFKTVHDRQDLSTGYLVHVPETQQIIINQEHFSDFKVTKNIPNDMGAMYKFYLHKYQEIMSK